MVQSNCVFWQLQNQKYSPKRKGDKGMKKKMTSVVLAMVMAVCMCGTIRVEAASPSEVLAPLETSSEPSDILVQYIHTEKLDLRESGEVVIAYYVVTEEGVTMESIADRLRITEEYLLSENDGRMLELEGELPMYAYIALPEVYWGDVENVYYFVQRGDSLTKISEYFHTSIADIQKLNPQITDPNLIYTEDVIRVK